MHAAPTVPIASGVSMPLLGLGVFRAGDPSTTIAAVERALDVGYRHIDTAAIYRNEESVGEGLRRWCDRTGNSPAEVFITTKLWNDDHGYDDALRAFDASRERLGVDVDLYLLHWPISDKRLDSWRALERLLDEGRVRAIGVSNFTQAHLDELLAVARHRPAVNQIELHPLLPQSELVAACRTLGIQTVAYSPLTKGRHLDEPALVQVAERHGRSPAQVLIRWGLQQGHVVLPKSSHPGRIAENAAVFDFTLDEADLASLSTLARGVRTAWDPTGVR